MFKRVWEKWTDPTSQAEVLLRSFIPVVRLRTLERITHKLDQTIAASTLERLLKDGDVDIRDTALEYCQWHHPAKHDDYLSQALFDKTMRIRWKAVRHLSSFPTPKAAARLREMFHSEEEKVKPYIMRALGKCEDGQTAPFLYKILTDKPLSPFAKAAGIGLGSLGAKAYVEPLIQLVNSPETEQAEGAVWALGEIGDPVGSSRVDLQACKLEYSIVSPK